MASHQSKGGVQAQTLAFSDGPKVITQPAQGPPLALAQISGLAGVTTQKAQVNTHTVSQQHTPNVQHRPGKHMYLYTHIHECIFPPAPPFFWGGQN